jgi:hypothetical protein
LAAPRPAAAILQIRSNLNALMNAGIAYARYSWLGSGEAVAWARRRCDSTCA